MRERKLSLARALRLDARDARRERRGRRIVTRARRARRARVRASRPVAVRAASRTRFGTSSRHVSVKARREACFTRFRFFLTTHIALLFLARERFASSG